MEEIRSRVDDIVQDQETAEKLKPYYQLFCKRPTFSDTYLPTFNRSNVQLVDTDGQGVDRITEKGLVVNGHEYEVDCIIFATGFEVGSDYSHRAGCDIYGREGKALSEHWRDGARSLHGMSSHGFPNMFTLHAIQGGLTINITHLLDELAKHQAHIIKNTLEKGCDTVEVSQQAEGRWVETILSYAGKGPMSEIAGPGCTPSFFNNEGKSDDPVAIQSASYGGGSVEFFNLLDEWRKAGSFEGLEFK